MSALGGVFDRGGYASAGALGRNGAPCLTVEQYPAGLLLVAPSPLELSSVLLRALGAEGYRLVDVAVGQVLGGVALTKTAEDGKRWRAELDERAREASGGDPELEWLLGTDTGSSSRTLFSVLAERFAHRAGWVYERAAAGGGRGWHSTPADASDFGRCFRLLERFPAWRERLHQVVERFPAWRGLVEVWPELEAAYSVGELGRVAELLERARR